MVAVLAASIQEFVHIGPLCHTHFYVVDILWRTCMALV